MLEGNSVAIQNINLLRDETREGFQGLDMDLTGLVGMASAFKLGTKPLIK
jgi:hypothetical protein